MRPRFGDRRPHCYLVLLKDSGIRAEIAASEHGAFYRFRFPSGEAPTLLLAAGGARLDFPSAAACSGALTMRSGRTACFLMAFGHPPAGRNPLRDGTELRPGRATGEAGRRTPRPTCWGGRSEAGRRAVGAYFCRKTMRPLLRS